VVEALMGLTKHEAAAGLDYKHARNFKLPQIALDCLANIPDHFKDDGCSNSPDSFFGFDFRWACRIHDHWYCSRAHPWGTMTDEWKDAGDLLLKRMVRHCLPRRWRWVGKLYYHGVQMFGGHAFDSCHVHPDALCRHGLSFDDWYDRTAECDLLRSRENRANRLYDEYQRETRRLQGGRNGEDKDHSGDRSQQEPDTSLPGVP
jgi:hypothetical protein